MLIKIWFTLILSLITTSVYSRFLLNDTGINTCANATQNGLPCPVTNFLRQDAEYGTNAFNFTKLDATGKDLPATATNHHCVKDNLTGLIWEIKTDDSDLRDKDWTYTWFSSTQGGTASGTTNCNTVGRCDTEKFVADVNTQGLCGYNDWRLPNPYELVSLIDYSVTWPGPTIDKNYFVNTLYGYNSYFWTGQPVANDSSTAWIIDFFNGNVDTAHHANSNAIRLVRGEQMLFSKFIANTDGSTVTDHTTGLMWIKCADGQSGTNCENGNANHVNWEQALTIAQNSTVAGYKDWRMPNVKELQTLVNYTKHGPSIDTSIFPNTPSKWFHTASANAHNANNLWIINFGNGNINGGERNFNNAMRLVRSANSIPTAITTAPSDITESSARLNGIVHANGSAATINFNFGTSISYDQQIIATPNNIDATVATNVSADQVGLTCGTTYYYQIKAVNSIGTSLSRNQVFTTAACPRDLIVTDIVLKPVKPALNKPFDARITVTNQGTMDAAANILKLWINQSKTSTCTTDATKLIDIAALAAGTSTTVTVTELISNSVGINVFRTLIDGTCIINEINEANNQRTFNYRIHRRLPDLIITNVTLTPSIPIKNTILDVNITIKNQGTDATGTSYVDMWNNRATEPTCGMVGKMWANTGSLGAGDSRIIKLPLPSGGTGSKTLQVFVDSWCEEIEIDETNNKFTTNYTVQ